MAGKDPEIHIRTTADTRGVEKTEKAVAKLVPVVSEAGKVIDGMGDEAVVAGRKLDDLGDEAAQAARQVDRLNDEIAESERRLKGLAAAFAETGDKSLFRQMRDERGQLGNLKRAAALLGGPAEAARAGAVAAPKTAGDIAAALPAQGKVAMVAGISAAVIAGAPVIGAAVNAAILAGLGAGGLALGIASAVRDPAVKDAFSGLGREFVTTFDSMGGQFEQPLMRAATSLRSELRDISGEWSASVGGLADTVEPLAEGIAGLFREADVATAFRAAEPVLRTLAKELPGLGEDLSTFFESLDSGSEGAAEGMKFLVDSVGDLLVVSGEVIEFLSKWFDLTTDIAAGMGRLGAAATAVFGPLGPMLQQSLAAADGGPAKIISVKEALDAMGDSAGDAAIDVKALHRATTDLLGQFLDMEQMSLRIEQGWDDIREAIDKNGATLDIHSEKGRENRDVILGQMDAIIQQRQKMIDSGQSVAAANDVYNRQRDALLKLAVAMGISRSEIEKWLAKFDQIPASKTVTLQVRQVFSSQGQAFRIAGGPATFMARGGVVAAASGLVAQGGVVGSPTVLFGERSTGTEVFVPERGISRERGLALASVAAGMHGGSVVAGGGGGGGSTTLTVTGGGGSLEQAFAQIVHYLVRIGAIQLSVRSGQSRVVVG